MLKQQTTNTQFRVCDVCTYTICISEYIFLFYTKPHNQYLRKRYYYLIYAFDNSCTSASEDEEFMNT